MAYDLVDGRIVETPGAAHSDDRLHIARRANTPAQAQALAQGALESNEERGASSIVVMGDTRLAAGVTIRLEGFGKLSADYLVHRSTHTLSRSGYETSLDIKRIRLE